MCVKPWYEYVVCHHTVIGPMIPCRRLESSPDNHNNNNNNSGREHIIHRDLKRVGGRCPDCQARLANSRAGPSISALGGRVPSQQNSSALPNFVPSVQNERAAAELLGSTGIPGWSDRASVKAARVAGSSQVGNRMMRHDTRQRGQVLLEEPPQLSLDQPAQQRHMTKYEAMSRAWITAQDAIAAARKETDEQNEKGKGKGGGKTWESPVQRQQREQAEAAAALQELATTDCTKDGSNKKRIHSTDNIAGSGQRRSWQGSESISAAYRPTLPFQGTQTLTFNDLDGPSWTTPIDPSLMQDSSTTGAAILAPRGPQPPNPNIGVQGDYPNAGWRQHNSHFLPEIATNDFMISPNTGPIGGMNFGHSLRGSDDLFSVSSLEFSPPNSAFTMERQTQRHANPIMSPWLRQMPGNETRAQTSPLQEMELANPGGNSMSRGLGTPTALKTDGQRPSAQAKPAEGAATSTSSPTPAKIRPWGLTTVRPHRAGSTPLNPQLLKSSGTPPSSRGPSQKSLGASNKNTLTPAEKVVSGFKPPPQNQHGVYAYNEIPSENSGSTTRGAEQAEKKQTATQEQQQQQKDMSGGASTVGGDMTAAAERWEGAGDGEEGAAKSGTNDGGKKAGGKKGKDIGGDGTTTTKGEKQMSGSKDKDAVDTEAKAKGKRVLPPRASKGK